MSDERDNPGVRPLTWFTLGLLTFTWWVFSIVWVRYCLRRTPDWCFTSDDVCMWAFVTGPLYLFAGVAWFGRRCNNSEPLSLPGSIVYALLMVINIALQWVGSGREELVAIPSCLCWLAGYPLGLMSLLIVMGERNSRI